MMPCSSCGRWDHSRPTSKDCPNYMPRRSVISDFKQTSVIKANLESCCRNQLRSGSCRKLLFLSETLICGQSVHGISDCQKTRGRPRDSKHQPKLYLQCVLPVDWSWKLCSKMGQGLVGEFFWKLYPVN
jgi:hypothetical protein